MKRAVSLFDEFAFGNWVVLRFRLFGFTHKAFLVTDRIARHADLRRGIQIGSDLGFVHRLGDGATEAA